MELYIDKNSKPEEVKGAFSSCYPFLKIELYRQDTAKDSRYKKEAPVLNRFTGLLREGFVDIAGNITIAQLMEAFTTFGLKVKVFRKSGDFWIGTQLTHNLTLQQQNRAGEEITNQV